MNNQFLNAVKVRRSIYALDKNITLSDAEIQTTIEQSMLQAPAAFGVQPTRTVVLFGQHHDKLWSMVETALQKITNEEQFYATKQKIASFNAGYGTILFFEDQEVVKMMQSNAPLYAEKFPDWALQAQGIAVYSLWCALADQQIGASIQHYNPLIDNDVKMEWNLPASWTLLGQMPFGRIVSPAATKAPVDVSILVKIIK